MPPSLLGLASAESQAPGPSAALDCQSRCASPPGPGRPGPAGRPCAAVSARRQPLTDSDRDRDVTPGPATAAAAAPALQTRNLSRGGPDGSGQGSRRGSHVYEINTWLWNFGRPQPRIGGLSVAKTEGVRRQSRSETSRRAAETKKARKRAVDQI